MQTKSFLIYFVSVLLTISALSIGILGAPLDGDNGGKSVSRSVSDPEKFGSRSTCDIKKYKKGDVVELVVVIPGDTYTTKAGKKMSDSALYGTLDLTEAIHEKLDGPSKHFKVAFTANFGNKKTFNALAQVFADAEMVDGATEESWDLASCYWVIYETK